ncbi:MULTISPECIES: hypothetical protein [Actinosynnema]|uniref:hypothetical protein n=1 Tax=Actinosynnema TaxID=40566 RepID=UPI0020A5E09D|nr:hypothetical protein [Actinosynnema pretiosum]MCP2096198.1 hypothetical protein [Actinosynnema pretiosum]
MTNRLVGALAAFADLGEARTLRQVVEEHLGPRRREYDVPALTEAYREALNERLDPVGLSVDTDDGVYADGWVDAEITTELDDALYRVDLAVLAERHRHAPG